MIFGDRGKVLIAFQVEIKVPMSYVDSKVAYAEQHVAPLLTSAM